MGGSQKCLKIQEEFVKYILYQLCCLSCQWKSWLQCLEIINNTTFQIKTDEKTHSIKIPQLVDDTNLVGTSKEEISLPFNKIETFGNFSGLLMNKNKTEVIWVGKLKHSKNKMEGIKWPEKNH